MTVTTIKVSTTTRDRLKEHAERAGVPLGVFVDRLLDETDRKERFERLRAQIGGMTPEQRASYERERDEWLDADLS